MTAITRGIPLLKGDPTQLTQVLLNLCVNARDAMPNGGTITFRTAPIGDGPLPAMVAAAPADFICFSVADTRCGISGWRRTRLSGRFGRRAGVG